MIIGPVFSRNYLFCNSNISFFFLLCEHKPIYRLKNFTYVFSNAVTHNRQLLFVCYFIFRCFWLHNFLMFIVIKDNHRRKKIKRARHYSNARCVSASVICGASRLHRLCPNTILSDHDIAT